MKTMTTRPALVAGSIDAPAARQAVEDLLLALGRDASDPHLEDTPRRVVEALVELLTPPRSGPSSERYSGDGMRGWVSASG